MKKCSIAFICFLLSLSVFAQTIEVIKIFPDGQPLKFGTTWDDNEGAPPGPYLFQFFDRNTCIMIDSTTREFIFLDSNWKVLKSDLPGWGPRNIAIGKSMIALSASSDNTKILMIDKQNIMKPIVEIQAPINWSRFTGVIAGNYLFKPNSIDKSLLSWEINKEKGTYVYRDQEQTMRLLEDGLAEELGLIAPYNDLKFTSRMYSMSKISLPIVPFRFKGYQYDKNQFQSFKLNESGLLNGFQFIGTDSRGLYYFSAVSPFLLIPSKSFSKEGDSDNDPINAIYTNIDKQLVFAIADPWQKKIIFRILPKNSWNPPADAEHGLLGSYPAAIHPDGHIYFFDGDEKAKSFILKRVVNDWWQELGFDKKQVGIVNDNRVRIRKTAATNADILGYVYEMEYALILDKSAKQETIGGQTSYWYKVRMWDDRIGWVFGAFLDIQ